jgi:hypothetical protein
MKCKVFYEDPDYLENDVNDWLKTENIEISHTTQSIDDQGNVILTLFYFTEKELRKKKLNKLNNYDTEN